MSERITTKKLAKICGVSLGTIDRALNNRYGINPETRDFILEKAREYGYTPNRIGRSLQSGKTFDIGVIVHDLDNRFFSQIVNTIQQAAWDGGYFIDLAISLRDSDREMKILEHMVERNVDGILLFPTGKGEELTDYLKSIQQPVICMGNNVKDSGTVFVGIEDRKIVYSAVSEIITRGYEKLIFAAPYLSSMLTQNNYATEQRLEGFLSAVADFDIEYEVFNDWGYLERIVNCSNNEIRTAVLCASDIFALEVLKHARESEIEVPKQLGVFGFDDLDILKYVLPALSTIHYPVKEMGIKAFNELRSVLEGRKVNEQNIIIKSEIIWRDSI